MKSMNDCKFQNMKDAELEKYLVEYSKDKKGEIAALTRAAALRIGVLSGRVRQLEKEVDDGR